MVKVEGIEVGEVTRTDDGMCVVTANASAKEVFKDVFRSRTAHWWEFFLPSGQTWSISAFIINLEIADDDVYFTLQTAAPSVET